jgi:hypothetical protein
VGEGGGYSPPLRPVRPGTKKPATTSPTSSTETNEVSSDDEEQLPANKPTSNYMGLFTTVITLFLVLCGLFTVYLYHYHGQRIKQLLSWKRNKNAANAVEQGEIEQPQVAPPKPPPRTKRHSQIRDITSDESSVLTGAVMMQNNENKNTNNNSSMNQPPECA